MSTSERPLGERMEELEEHAREVEERREAVENGEVPAPWPHSSKATFVIAGAAFVSGGTLLASGSLASWSMIAGLVSILAAVTAASYGRWISRHFETGQQPTYDSATNTTHDETSTDA